MGKKNRESLLSDEQIIDLYFAREERAIEETDKKYCHYLHSVAYNILANEQDIEECLQDTYLRTWNTIPPERPNVFRAFLAKITRNLSLDRYEHERRQKRVPTAGCVPLDEVQEFVPDGSDLDRDMQAEQIGKVITAYLDATTDRRLYIFVSRYFFALTLPQIAKRLSCSQSLVSKELAEIKRELRILLEKEGVII
jgi:RNA polymerase sigma-70 factor (ECF subfamily)